MRRYKDISGCRLLRVLTKTLIFDVTGVNMHYLSENSAGDNAEATSPRWSDKAFYADCLLRRGLVGNDSFCFLWDLTRMCQGIACWGFLLKRLNVATWQTYLLRKCKYFLSFFLSNCWFTIILYRSLKSYCHSRDKFASLKRCTVEPQWLEHLRDHDNSFETWVVRATEG